MKNRSILLLASLLSISSIASAQFNKPEDATRYRKAGFTIMAAHFGRIGAMVNGKAPFDAAAAASNAQIVEQTGALPWAGFVAGSEEGSKAKPEVWSNAAKFKEASDKFRAESAKLTAATKTGNQDQIKVAFGATAATCKACHDTFKKD
jgi:cytochrome c556